MFDVGFSELIVIGLVALIVIGPERLPKVARTVGHLVGRLQRYVADVKSDIQREMQLDELKKLQSQMQDSARELENSVRTGIAGVESEIAGVAAAATSIAEPEPVPAIGHPATAEQPAGEPLAAEVDERQLDLALNVPPPVPGESKGNAA
ncbi:MAG: twin-arginine translocase subunit TatB [Zoogloea sp.]|nr:twin-arginine translocase subunit TatB [Zoogloea sp.]